LSQYQDSSQNIDHVFLLTLRHPQRYQTVLISRIVLLTRVQRLMI
jgi:hypothetical protein